MEKLRRRGETGREGRDTETRRNREKRKRDERDERDETERRDRDKTRRRGAEDREGDKGKALVETAIRQEIPRPAERQSHPDAFHKTSFTH